MADRQRFLVKMRSAPGDRLALGSAALSIGGASVPLTVTPLFSSIGVSSSTSTLGLAAPLQWHLVEAAGGLDAGPAWDVCHQMVGSGLGIAGSDVSFAEPDLQQTWLSMSPDDGVLALTATCDAVPQKTGSGGYPGEPDEFWYQDDEHGQYASALASLAALTPAGTIRVAHLDTGYDPQHKSLPARLSREEQRNFVDDDRPNDASDDSSGVLNNRGHGTGTLSILAGAPIAPRTHGGVAPFAQVIPVRVANRVEIFYSSAIAKAFDYVHGLCATAATQVHVVTMSMGGLASQAWADAVNALYDAGVVVVTAAGNNFHNAPTRNIVFPARFNRVVAACGAMADGTPFANLGTRMAGNYGPASKMRTAVAAWTPNVPWASFGCPGLLRFDGTGTSAATPQVAATVAMWLLENKTACDQYGQKWMRVEAARRAIFASAQKDAQFGDQYGNGKVRAADALKQAPAAAGDLVAERPDSASFGFLRVLTGLGLAAEAPGPQQQMLELEALQLSQSASVEAVLPDPNVDPATLSPSQRLAIAQALAQHPKASNALRNALGGATQTPGAPPSTSPSSSPSPSPSPSPSSSSAPASPPVPAAPPIGNLAAFHVRQAVAPPVPAPPSRRLRVYTFDPVAGRALETFRINEAVLDVRWEENLAPGPVGEYLEVVDVDPASRCCYAPVDLNDLRLLATDGLKPSEANPQFHQQMAYAVAMKTIEHFERALGRVALWSSRFTRPDPQGTHSEPGKPVENYVQRLRIYPHAMRTANSYYSPQHKALLLGYFRGGDNTASAQDIVFCTLSHDIVAHETTHALVDGLHPRFREPSNPDVLAFHEAFADLVALFQHFSIAEALREQIAAARGDLNQETLLSKIAVQFGSVLNQHGALRDYIGQTVEDPVTHKPVWTRVEPEVRTYREATEPHDRGKVLVAAVFDAFLKIYGRVSLESIRLATNGSEILPQGALSTPLVEALTRAAASVSRHVLTMCIRALDYCPPVDITFGDFLRAVITADHDLVANDRYGYRIAFVSAFAARGIFPEGVRTPSVETMVWEAPPSPIANLRSVLDRIDLRWDLQSDRRHAWRLAHENAKSFWEWLKTPGNLSDEELEMLGIRREPDPHFKLRKSDGTLIDCDLRGFEVHSVRPLRRIGPDGEFLAQLVVEVTQSLHANDRSGQVFRGGATLIIDLTRREATYLVRKRFDVASRVSAQQALWAGRVADAGDVYNGVNAAQAEPFALLHRCAGNH